MYQLTSGQSAETIRTPLADAYATRRHALFSDVPKWVRGIELRAMVLAGKLVSAAELFPATVLLDAKRQIDTFLLPETGRFARILARPPEHLVLGSQPRRQAESAIAMLLDAAERAIATGEGAAVLEREIAADRFRFSTKLPNLTTKSLGAARLHHEDIVALTSVASVDRARRRFEATREILTKYESAALDWTGATTSDDDARPRADGEFSIDELHAFLLLSRRSRQAQQRRSSVADHVRSLAIRQFDDLSTLAADVETTASGMAVAKFIERANGLALRATPARGDEAIATAGALGGAARAASMQRNHRPTSEQFRWRPTASGAVPGPIADAQVIPAEVWGVTQIAADTVCVSRSDDAMLRNFNAALTVDGDIDVVVQSGRQIRYDDVLRSDMEALLDVSDSGAGWYKQTVRARVRIFATDGEHYFGRVLRKGSLVRIANTGARQTAPAGLNIRLLGPDCESLGPPTIQDIAFEGLAFKFGGIRCQGARSGLQNAEAVVAHFPDDPENAVAAQALDRERALFAILADKGMPSGGTLVGLGSTFVGFGATRQIATCVLYRAVPHLQMGDDDSTMWLRESDELTFAAIVGISRIFTTCWNGKWSVGSCTLPMFGFAPRWDPVSGLPLPSAKLLTAPFATPFGQPHIMPCSESEFSATNHARLGISALSARIKKGEESNIGTDMLGLASLCFELLANSRIDYGEGHRASWGGIIRVAGERVQFRQPGFVAIAAAAAKTAQGRALLIQMFQAVATGMLRNFTECQESLEREI